MVRVTPVTSRRSPLSELRCQTDLERSLGFHQGTVAIDPDRAATLLAALPPAEWPQLCVHVAGSEGKTSTTELIAAGLRAPGRAVGTFTSPHLVDERERVRIDGEFVDDDRLAAAVRTVLGAVERLPSEPTWFECLTAVARVLFVPPHVQAAVWETGLGGRLDATRHLRADVCVVTSISLEHTAILGDTLTAIATEKAGILRPGVPLVMSGSIAEPAADVLRGVAGDLACPVTVVADADVDIADRSRVLARAVLDGLVAVGRLPADEPGRAGRLEGHQVAGRLQRVGRVLFDGAHTVAAATLLARHLSGIGPVGCLVFGATVGRDAEALLAPLLEVCPRVILTRAPGDRGVDPGELADRLEGHAVTVEADPRTALARAGAETPSGQWVVVTGSLHLLGELLPDAGGCV